MSTVRLLSGDFRSGRVEFDGLGLSLQRAAGGGEYVNVSNIGEIIRLEREWQSGFGDKLTGLATGGIVGGVAAGAMAGGLTGPAGAVIGAIAGAVLTARRFETCHVSLVDGRRFVATASDETWSAIRKAACIERSPGIGTYSGNATANEPTPLLGRLRRQLPSFMRRSSPSSD